MFVISSLSHILHSAFKAIFQKTYFFNQYFLNTYYVEVTVQALCVWWENEVRQFLMKSTDYGGK